MTEIVECSLKDMRNFFYKGERVRAHSVKSGWSGLCKVIYVGPFVQYRMATFGKLIIMQTIYVDALSQ